MNSLPGSAGVSPASPLSKVSPCPRAPSLINTGASARCTQAPSTIKLFQQFFVRSWRDLDTFAASAVPVPICGRPESAGPFPGGHPI